MTDSAKRHSSEADPHVAFHVLFSMTTVKVFKLRSGYSDVLHSPLLIPVFPGSENHIKLRLCVYI